MKVAAIRTKGSAHVGGHPLDASLRPQATTPKERHDRRDETMNDYEMTKLAEIRSHEFRREAAQHRLAANVARRTPSTPRGTAAPAPRSTIRLTLDYLFGRGHA